MVSFVAQAWFTNVYNPRALIERKPIPRTGKGATLGANCTIVCGVTVGEYALLLLGRSSQTLNLCLVAGVPAKQTGWISQYGEKIPLPLKARATAIPPHRQAYQLRDQLIEIV